MTGIPKAVNSIAAPTKTALHTAAANPHPHLPRPARHCALLAMTLALFVFSDGPVSAQNLVPNGSFETNTGIPTGYSQLTLAAPWTPPTTGSPDYFHALASGPSGMSVPVNDFGNQVPHPASGQAYAGFNARPVNQYREYVETPLSTPLVAGQTYQISFYVSLADQCQWAVDKIGAYLSIGPVGPVNTGYTLSFLPQISNPVNSYITNKTGWTLISGQYVAAGGEDHLVIGNFYDNPSTTPLMGQGGAFPFAYYYLDDVSVTLAAPPCVPPPSGMVAWYPLDEFNGATMVNDIAPPPSSLVNNVGTTLPGPIGPILPGNGPASVPGQVSSAQFFYTGHYNNVAPQAELDFGTGDFSIDAWIRVVNVNPTLIQPIVDKLDIPNGNIGYAFYIQDRYLKLNMNGTTFSSTTQVTFANPLANTGPWYHVAVTVKRNTGLGTFYINGVAAGPSFTPPLATVTNVLPMWIGESRLPGGRGEIAIDELEIFNRAITLAEVLAIFNGGSGGKCKLDKADLGDAPDSTNHYGTTMTTTYAVGNFPTVYDPPSPGPVGPIHLNAKGLAWLGKNVTFEGEADSGWDQDPTNNLLASGSPLSADHDLADDGVTGVPLPDCAMTQVPISATNALTTPVLVYLNTWFDWTRDGDWDDIPRCAVAPNVDAIAAEWAVQNQAITLAPGFNAALLTAPFRSINPLPGKPAWMRMTLTNVPINAANNGGPFPLPADLGKGGSGPAGGYVFGETEDYLVDVKSGRTEICVLKFEDKNGNGQQDPGELGLPNWTINVTDAGGNVIATNTTGPGGTFCFSVPAPAPYTISEVLQSGWTQTYPGTPGTHSITTSPGQLVNLKFGNKRKKTACCIYLPIAVKNINLDTRLTPSTTRTPTPRGTRTLTATPNRTPTGSTTEATPTPRPTTPIPSVTASRTTEPPSTTATPTPTSGGSAQPPSATATPTPTTGGSAQPPSATNTPTATPSGTTPVPSATVTPTPSPTPSRTATPPTATPTPTPGGAVPSPSATPTPGGSVPTPSATPSATNTPSPTPSGTTPAPASTSTPTPTPSSTDTPTPTSSSTPTPTSTHTPTPGTPGAVPTATPGCAARPAGMAAWWDLDELSGTTAWESVAGNNGTVEGVALVVNPAKVAAGRSFDGTSGRVLVPSAAALNAGTADLSIDAWIRPKAVNGLRPILTKQYAPADAPLGYALYLQDGQPTFEMSNENGAIAGTAPMTMTVDGQWHLLAATIVRGSATGGRLYLDGALIHTFDTTPITGTVDTPADLLIAGQPALGRGLAARYFNDGIDEVELFHRALSAGEVLSLYTAGTFGKCDKPVRPTATVTPTPIGVPLLGWVRWWGWGKRIR